MAILERVAQLQHLHDRLMLAASGREQLVFLSAEAGGGTTAVVDRFTMREIRAGPGRVI